MHLRALNVLAGALNALTQHGNNAQVLLQIHRGTYKRACLNVNLHMSCTIVINIFCDNLFWKFFKKDI